MSVYDLLKEAGLSPAALAKEVGVNKATVSRWNGTSIPASRVKDVERATGIPARKLRPDLAEIFSGIPQGDAQ